MVFRGARPLEYTMWKALFENGNAEEFLSVLASYQNADGGFGHNIEANLWNPHSSPEVTACALDNIGRAGLGMPDKGHPIVTGVLKFLTSEKYLTDDGWLCGLPSNLECSHAPWFGYDPQNEVFRILDPLLDFIFNYAEEDSEIYKKATSLKAKQRPEEPAVCDFSGYDPAKFEPWGLLPTDVVKSPESALYPIYKDVVDMELDGIADRLAGMDELPVADYKDMWEDVRQVIGFYYWASSDIITQIGILKTFGRLEFTLPVSIITGGSLCEKS